MKHRRLGQAGGRWIRQRARTLLGDPERVKSLLRDAEHKSQRHLGAARHQLAVLVRLLRAWVNGRYRDVEPATLLAAVGAVLYFVLPLDLIPDPLLGFGLVDDVAVIAWVVNQIRSELERFEAWEQQQQPEAVESGKAALPSAGSEDGEKLTGDETGSQH